MKAVANIMQIEEQFFREINSMAGRFELIDWAMITLSSPNTWIIVGLSAFLIILLKRNQKVMDLFISTLIALAAADLTSFRIIKPLFARERPCRILEDVNLILNHCGGSYGFTSNHAANAFAVWAILASKLGLRSAWSLLALTLASSVALSRVYLGVHFWGDILGGAALGIITAAVVQRLRVETVSSAISQRLFAYLPSSGK